MPNALAQAGISGFAPTIMIGVQALPSDPTPTRVEGFAPTILIGNPEQEKYTRLWERPEYRVVSPGEQWALTFLHQAHVERDSDVIDFGCGTGRGSLMLSLLGSMRVTMFDFAPNCLDAEVVEACKTQPDRIKFIVGDLLKAVPVSAAYGYCCDVMEHIQPSEVSRVLRNILASANHCFFAISTVEDKCGALIGEPLHLTIQPMSWWLDQLRSLGAVIHWCDEREGCCAIYCSTWRDAGELIDDTSGKVNVDMAEVENQIEANVRAGWKHVTPFDRQNREVVLLAGGPSMNDHVDQIRSMREAGAVLITCNGSYKWALDHGLSVSAQIVLDARPFNARFTKPVVDHCKYLVASQVHPSTLEGLPYDRTFLWHSGISEKSEKLIRDITGAFYPVPGGSTVVLRSFALLRMLGFWRLHLFGFDSCVRPNGVHHAYAQPENDSEPIVAVTCGGRTFECTPWMLSQATEFRDVVKFLGDEVELAVYGDGLISQIIKTGASFSDLKE